MTHSVETPNASDEALNEQRLTMAIGVVEDGLRELNRWLSPDKHAQLIVAAYNLMGTLEASDKIADQDEQRVRDALEASKNAQTNVERQYDELFQEAAKATKEAGRGVPKTHDDMIAALQNMSVPTTNFFVEVDGRFGAKVNGELLRDAKGDPSLFDTAQEACETAEKLVNLNTPARVTPNPKSTLLASAIIGGCGIGPTPASVQPPKGMASILLYVPVESITGKTMPELQNDIGLPWSMVDAEGVCKGAWFDELKTSVRGDK